MKELWPCDDEYNILLACAWNGLEHRDSLPTAKNWGVVSQSKESKERLLFDIQTPLAKYDAVFKRLFPETWIFEFSPLLQSLPS